MVTTLWKGAVVVPMDGPSTAPCGDVRQADVRVADGVIVAVGAIGPEPAEVVRDASGLTMLPGFVQGHVHCCQTLFRGLADDRELLPWLRERIWPLEAAHDAASTRLSAELTVAELLRGGTTCIQAIESVRHAEQAFDVAAAAGMAATIGNCLMDVVEDGVPAGLPASRDESMRIVEELRAAYHGAGRLLYAVTPRFALSCSDALAADAAAFASQHDLRVHTHASENPAEIDAVQRRFGRAYLHVLADQGLLGPRSGLAHCVHLSASETDLLSSCGASVLHCPSTNLKLGSGIAPIAAYRARGIPVAIGTDGAPANNRLSALTELRQAALLQALHAGPGAWPAAQALWTATRGGALAIGRDDVGSIADGQRADLVLLDLRDPSLGAGADPVSKIVWSASEHHVREVVVDGRVAVHDGALLDVDTASLARRARETLPAILTRAGLAR